MGNTVSSVKTTLDTPDATAVPFAPTTAIPASNVQDAIRRRGGGGATLNPLDYGCVGDGVTDDTAAYLAMLNVPGAAERGAVIQHPYGSTFAVNLSGVNSIIQNGVTIQGNGAWGYGTFHPDFVPFDGTKPCLQVGNDTCEAQGITLSNISVNGSQNSGTVGLHLGGGAKYNYFKNLYIGGFSTSQIELIGATNYPITYNFFSDFFLLGPNGASGTCLKTFFNSGLNGWVTANYFHNGAMGTGVISPGTGYCIDNDGCGLSLSNVWIQPSDNDTCINLTNTHGTPGLACSNVTVDSPNSTWTYVNIPTNDPRFYLSTYVSGTFGMYGYVKRTDASTFFAASTLLTSEANINNSHIENFLYLVDNNNPSGTDIRISGAYDGMWLECPGTLNLDSGGMVRTLKTLDIANSASLPAGGSWDVGMSFCNTAVGVYCGTGVPAINGGPGSLYLRTDGAAGSRLYVSSGGFTWAAVAGV